MNDSSPEPTNWQDGHFIGGHPTLDFANTVFRRRPELGHDLLTDEPTLTTWFERAGIEVLGGAVPPPDPGAALAEARRLRALLWDLLDARAHGSDLPGPVLAAVLEVAREGLASGELVVPAQGPPVADGTRAATAAIALQTTGLVLSQGPLVRTCDRCGWFFLDASRGRRRRWCSMQTCGNRAKAARHRAAHR